MTENKLRLRLALGGSAALVRFYGELNDFLPPDRRGRLLVHAFHVGPSVKDAIESFGVPHPEVGLIVINREPASFSQILAPADHVCVYPAFHSIDISSLPQLRPSLDGPPRFVLDVHLGRLAAWLRLMGCDTAYSNHASDPDLAAVSVAENRILLTRDRGLLKRSEVVHGYWLRSTEPERQLLEVIRRFDLQKNADLFSRCLVCNGCLLPVDKAEVLHQLPPRTRECFDEIHRCAGCRQIYWKGSHYRRILYRVGRILREAQSG